MCGICGYINLTKKRHDVSVLQNMVKTLHHRGPDSQGYYENQQDQVFLGHSRLSIIDISDNGRQPMSFGKLTIAFNGEIYNYSEIKKELCALGHSFKTNSDTEVILHSYQEWGNSCVKRFIGMFAFAIYDSDKRIITFYRDRAGVKPLYYYYDQHVFIFGSELKAFHNNPLFKKDLNFDALGLYMKYGYIPTPHCVFQNTFKLRQGSYLIFDINKKTIETNKYWDLEEFYLKPKLDISYEEALEETEKLLVSAFKYRMVADVPVGVFLSAGYDSTCVAALLQSNMTGKLRTFTIGFEKGNNEAPRAKEIAAYLGTDHTEHYCSEEDGLGIIKDIPYFFDEPFADNSAIPTILVSKVARQHVKVALSADGGDEIFAGYESYDSYMKGYSIVNHVPKIMRKTLGHITDHSKFLFTDPVTHRRLAVLSEVLLSDRNIATSLSNSILSNTYLTFNENIYTESVNDIPTVYSNPNEQMTILSRLLYADYIQYMQDDILVKVDRATMSASLEGRNPLLDHRLIEFVAQIPDEYKYYHDVKKRILKDIVYKYIPKQLIDKPKTGFSVPLHHWLNDGFKEQVEYYLSDTMVKKMGVYNEKYVDLLKRGYQKSNKTIALEMWKTLQLQMWLERWL